jgi:ABC-2 type transport system permease protein/sodium transport system permease protein
MFPLYFTISNSLYRVTWISPTVRLIASATVTALLFAGLPLLVGRVQNVVIREAFRLRGSHVLAFLSAAILGVSLWPMAHEIFLMNEILGLSSLSEERIKAAEELLESWRNVSPLLILFTLAVTPAICEEFFFRGYLFTAFRGRFSPTWTILITAVLFGVFHVVVTSSLAVERMLPSTFMGLILGWVCWRTGSAIPGMLLHACHNGLLLMIACYRDELILRGWGVAERSHLPTNWLLASAVGVAIGLVLLWFTTSPEHAKPRRTLFVRPQANS